ncbi:MAG: 30S ribosomal protein S20 [Lactobacillales bacterium]|jgi:small subunit ribosomal protein S20|nr:30S ribosomal protein S20 [Lactobacillales bacterium]
MANLKSSKTRVKRNQKRAKINSDRLGAARTQVKQTRAAIAAGNKEEAAASFKAAESKLARAAGKGTIHKKTASRKISRLSAAVKAMSKK